MTGPPARLSLATIDGRLVGAFIGALLVALFVARVSTPAFVVLGVVGLAVIGYAAHRWPWPIFVLAAVISIADLVVMPRLLPSGVTLGPLGVSEPMLAVAGLVIAVDAVRRGTFVGALRDPVLPLTVLFVALAVLSALVNATPPVVALLGIVMTVDAIAVYFIVRMLPADARGRAFALGALVAATTAVALFGIAQVVLDPDLFGFVSFHGRFGEGSRITSIAGNPNMVAMIIGVGLPFALFGSRHLADGRWRWAARVALFLLVLALLLTFSRGAWLAIGIGAIVGALLVDWRALGILVLAVVLAWGATTVMPRNLLAGAADGSGDDPSSAPPAIVPDFFDTTVGRLGNLGGERELRIRFIRDGMPIISDHLLLGVGPGRYGGAAATIIPSPVYEEYGTSLFRYRTVHNFWLHLLGESGALGTAVFLVILLTLLIRLVRAARTTTGSRFVLVGGGAALLLVAGLHSLTEMVFEGNMPVMLIWLMLGAASTVAPSTQLLAGRSTGPESPT